jgi:hypothetical protein
MKVQWEIGWNNVSFTGLVFRDTYKDPEMQLRGRELSAPSVEYKKQSQVMDRNVPKPCATIGHLAMT